MNNHKQPELRGNILIVDDNQSNLEILTHILEERHYEVRGAIDGETALMMIQHELPDLILLDIRMPGGATIEMSGYDVCERLKADPVTREVPVIFISALDEPINKLTGFSKGAVDYITKPFNDEEVIARVNIHLSLSLMQKQLATQNEQLIHEIAERRRAEASLQRINDELEQRVCERTAELLVAKEAAEAASRAKTAFLSCISHEFRTPLNPIIGLTSVLIAKPETAHHDCELLKMILKSGDQLLSMVNHLIEICNIESKGVKINFTNLELEGFLRSVTGGLSSQALQKGLKISYQLIPPVPAYIVSDQDLLHQILNELGKNAIKFTEQGEVWITVQKYSEQGAVQFSVNDTGVGIPADQLPLIFQDFTQADSSTTRKYGGIGLGLTLIRKLIRYLGGSFWVESTEGKGSSFHFTLQKD